MRSDSDKSNVNEKDWDLFFQGDRNGLYACFHLFYDDFYRLGLYWYGNPDFIKECIHNLFLELWKGWTKTGEIRNKKQYVITVFRRVCNRTHQEWSPIALTDNVNRANDVDSLHELPYEELLIASQTLDSRKQQLHHALQKLTNRQREIIRLRFFEGRSFQEIAETTSLTERTVYNTLHNAIKALRKQLTWIACLCALCLIQRIEDKPVIYFPTFSGLDRDKDTLPIH